MSKKLLFTFLMLLLLLNLTLLTVMVLKPEKKGPPRHIFLTEELQFTENQTKSFRKLDREHRRIMRSIDEEIRDIKYDFFQSFSDPKFSPEGMATKIGDLETKRDLELFRFFSEVRKLCTPEQSKRFDEIISEALRGGRRGPPPHERRPPPPRRGF